MVVVCAVSCSQRLALALTPPQRLTAAGPSTDYPCGCAMHSRDTDTRTKRDQWKRFGAACSTVLSTYPPSDRELLGHATISITLDVYSHILPDMQRDAAKAM